ncbi:MAG TPA: dehydrogenase E1 component subunit alpha/beta [Ignavibacteria bacterium]|nr:dehydrogenase E1 component subunit alpha/beta [Ignavibacteria bacterium]
MAQLSITDTEEKNKEKNKREVFIKFDRKNFDDDTLIRLYKAILLPRMIEEKMLLNLRLGKVSKWFSGIGQEAISVGVAEAMESDEYILPMHRNLGIFTSRKLPLDKLFMQLQGKYDGFSKARERSFHFGTNEHHIVGMISHLGPQLAIADGIALACSLNVKAKKDKAKITTVFTGDGGTSEGDFHEALNVAAVWDLPVVFIIENNCYGLSTPVNEQYKCTSLYTKAEGYGMEGMQIDGNNILTVYETMKNLSKSIKKKQKPVLLECMTFRMRGHEEASGTKYVPKNLFDEWGKKDPVTNYENFLLNEAVITEDFVKETRKEFKKEIESALDAAFSAPNVIANTEDELKDIYEPYEQIVIKPGSSAKSSKRFVDAISDGLKLAMEKYDNLILMGQDIAEYGGVFKITENFYKEFGKDRVRNTPLCESAIIGAALGLSVKHYKAMVEMQFADFVTSGFNQIVNNLAKIHYRWGQNADVVIRMPCGAGVGAGPFHSQSNEAWFFHTPGLKIFYPSNPYDAKGMMIAAFEDPNPVMFFEHKALYRSLKEDIPDDYYTIEIGKASIVKSGEEVSIITYGLGVQWAKNFAEKNPDIDCEIIDLRTLIPLDKETIINSVKKTGKVIILHEDTLTGGIGGEISAIISENCFEYLDAPVVRSAGLDTPVPFALELEQNFFPIKRFEEQIRKLVEY